MNISMIQGKESRVTTYGQVVVGPPGSGKTTYCRGLQEMMTGLNRKVLLVNADSANDTLPYRCDVNIAELVTLRDVMEQRQLGPNGAMVYCLEFLENRIDWLLEQLDTKSKGDTRPYVIFDFPGQVELYTHHGSVRRILAELRKHDFRLTTVQLVDSVYCADPAKFVAVLLTSLSVMVQLETPHINVLSKIDLVEQYGPLPLGLDFFTEVMDLNYLLELLQDDPLLQKFRNLNKALCGVIEDYSLVSYYTLNVQDKKSMYDVLKAADKANGYLLMESTMDPRFAHDLNQ